MSSTRPAHGGALRRWLDQPTRWWQTLEALVAGGGLYVLSILALGGFQQGDMSETLYPALLMAHGDWACAYPPTNPFSVPMAAPGFSVLSAALQWMLRLGFSRPFASAAHLGHACRLGVDIFTNWTSGSGALPSIIYSSVFAWLALAGAAMYLARQTSIGRTRQVCLIPICLAVTPPVFFAVQEYFHPQDQLALAFFLVAAGVYLRHGFALSGVLLAGAYVTQQYTAIGIVILVVLAVGNARWRLLGGFIVSLGVFTAVAWWRLGSSVLKPTLLGTGQSRINPGTLMAELHVPTLLGLGISRVAPLVLAGLLGAWCARRRPEFANDPELLLGLLAVGWSLRVLLEINLFGYYLLATAATLVLRDIVARRTSRTTLWLLLGSLVSFGHLDVWRHLLNNPPQWPYQIVFAPTTFVIALASLRSSLHGPRRSPIDPEGTPSSL